jgi:heat shock protein HtpX
LGALFIAIFGAVAAMLIQLAISRSREYQADASGAALSGDPTGLARALEKLEQSARRTPMEASPATSHLFIVSPFSMRGARRLLSTHPPVEDRIARLRQMAQG